MEIDIAARPRAGIPRPATDTRAWTLGLASAATFMLMLDVTVVNIALPKLRPSLGATFSDMQWVLDAYTLTLAAFLLTGGSLADRLGRKRLFAAGLFVFTAASLAAGLAASVTSLVISRGIQGIGAALLFAVGPALIGQEFRGGDRGKAFGVFGGVVGLALALGPVIGGAVTDALGWRWIFLINVPIGAAMLTAGAARLCESRDDRSRRIDWAGMLLFGSALILLVLGCLRAESAGWSSPPIIAAFAGAALLLGAFVALERARGPNAMLDLALFRVPTFNGVSGATFLSNATSLAAIFLEVSYLQNILGYSPLQTGVRMLPLTSTLFVVAAATGSLVNRIAPGLLLGLSIALIAVGMGLIALIDPTSSWTALLPSMIVMGVGMGIFNPPRAAVTIGVAEPAKAGMASGMGETFQQVGVAIGVAAFGGMFHARVVGDFAARMGATLSREDASRLGQLVAAGGGAESGGALPATAASYIGEAARASFVGGFRAVMLVCAVICGFGAAVAFGLIRRHDIREGAAP